MILIDDRAGSGPRTVTRIIDGKEVSKDYKGLNEYPPLNLCITCRSQFEWKVIKGVKTWQCSSGDLSHEPLCVISRLKSADVEIFGNGPDGPILIGVEVKSYSELSTSLSSGRFQAEQIPKMIGDPDKNIPAAYDVSWLLYYGEYRPNPDTGILQVKRWNKVARKHYWSDYGIGNRPIMYSYAASFLCSPSFTNTGILSHRVITIEEAAYWISVLHKTWQKPYSSHKSMRTFYKPSSLGLPPGIDKRTQDRMSMAKELPGLGYEKALAAAQHFPSITAMINAPAEEWSEIPVVSASGRVARIGKVIGKAIEEHVK